MAHNRRLQRECWTTSPQTRIQIRRSKETRDDQFQLPRIAHRARPGPIKITPAELSPFSTTSPPSPKSPEEQNLLCQSPLEPEIVDFAAPNTWPRRSHSQKRVLSKQAPSPSLVSHRSARHSEISRFLDYYYMRGPSLDLPPPTPRLDTPIIDPGLEKFDFGLPLKTSSPRSPNGRGFQDVVLATRAGAEEPDRLPTVVTPPQAPRPQPTSKNSYRLFPIVKDTSPPSATTAATESPYPRFCTPASNIKFVPSHNHPDPSYRPRRESLSSSIRSRKDSFSSFCGTKRIPIRVLPEGSAVKFKRSLGSESASSGSPLETSRWSDDTITSPVAATTPGPRTSFGSLLGRDSSQYPACFFEDDDEAAPLRRKLPWKRSTSLTQEQRARREALTGDRRSFGSRLKAIVLCAGCCGRDA
jgi:Wiskott-Aldrich syndrome protein